MRISDWSSDVCSSDSGSYGQDGGLSLDGGGTGGGVAGEDGFESMRGENLSLHDHLTTQAGAAFKGPDLIIAAHLIDLIEETRSEGQPPELQPLMRTPYDGFGLKKNKKHDKH